LKFTPKFPAPILQAEYEVVMRNWSLYDGTFQISLFNLCNFIKIGEGITVLTVS